MVGAEGTTPHRPERHDLGGNDVRDDAYVALPSCPQYPPTGLVGPARPPLSDTHAVPATRPRVLVVDDHSVVRQGTRTILELGGLEVVAEADSAELAIELVTETTPDVVLADVRLPGMSGIELAGELHRRNPDVRVLILSSYANPSYVKAALAAGAAGYLLKTASDEELVSAVRSASLGATVLDSTVSAELATGGAPSGQPLTTREREVLALVATGMQNKAIASRLNVSKRTVDAHLGHLFTKLGVGSRAELVAWAARHGLIEE